MEKYPSVITSMCLAGLPLTVPVLLQAPERSNFLNESALVNERLMVATKVMQTTASNVRRFMGNCLSLILKLMKNNDTLKHQ
jgi:hypothetical protein